MKKLSLIQKIKVTILVFCTANVVIFEMIPFLNESIENTYFPERVPLSIKIMNRISQFTLFPTYIISKAILRI